MDDGIEISELVHTISLLRRTQEYAPAPLPHSPIELKHLSVLDGIALLMVMGDKSDVVAVTYRQFQLAFPDAQLSIEPTMVTIRRFSTRISRCSAIHWAYYGYYQSTLRSNYCSWNLCWIESVRFPHWNWDFEAQLLAVRGFVQVSRV